MFSSAGLWSVGLVVALAGPKAAFGQQVSFAPVVNYAEPDLKPYRVRVADVNGDGYLDALTANLGPGQGGAAGSLGVLLGNGSGGFVLQSTIVPTQGVRFNSLEVADVNADGKPDVLLVNTDGGTLTTLLGNGNGGFGQSQTLSTGAYSFPMRVAIADVNGDGKLDALTSNTGNSSSLVSVLLGKGNGDFTLQPGSGATQNTSNPRSLVIADVNGDGKPDVLTANYSTNTLGVLLGDGRGGFMLQANSPSTGERSGPSDLVAADVNGDGAVDVIIANSLTSTVPVLLGDGRGGFSLQPNPVALQIFSLPASLTLADVNKDGNQDVLTVSPPYNSLNVLLGNGKGEFRLQPGYFFTGYNSNPNDVVAADVNGDGRPDVLTANTYTSNVGVLLNTSGSGVLSTRADLPGASVHLYPNPAHAAVALSLEGLPMSVLQVQATVLDALGRRVGQHTLSANGGTLPLVGLASGLYVVRLAALNLTGQILGELPTQRVSVR
jgi:hypothetical protein